MIHKETGLPIAEALLRAKVKLTLKAPFFAFYVNRSNVSLGHSLNGFPVTTGTTDGKSIVINPDYAAGLPMSELIFLLAHEGAHIGASHSLRAANIRAKRPETYNRYMLNVAADYLVNSGLRDEGFDIGDHALIDNTKTPENYTMEQLYAEMLEKLPKPIEGNLPDDSDSESDPESESESESGSGAGSGSDSPDSESDSQETNSGESDNESPEDDESEPDDGDDSESELDPEADDDGEDDDGDKDKDSESESESEPEFVEESQSHDHGGFIEASNDDGSAMTQDEIESELKRAGVDLRQALQAAKAAGKESGFGIGALEEISPSHVNWRQKLQEFTGRAILRDDYTWRRPNPRYNAFDNTYMPSLGRPGLKNLVIACDSSGSVSETAFSEFIQAVSEILEDHPQCEVTLIQCDSRIQSVAESQGHIDTSQIKRHGYGGTDFKPVFSHVENNVDAEPDCLLYFTDLWVGNHAFPKTAPTYPVLWLYARDNHNPHYTERCNLPFGDLAEYRDAPLD